jgi:hypothetical protein
MSFRDPRCGEDHERAEDVSFTSDRERGEMTKLTLRHFKGYFVVTGPDTEPAKFKTRRQAIEWCAAHYPDLPVREDRLTGKRLANKRLTSISGEQ